MNNLEVLEKISQKTNMKVELSNGFLYPKESSEPLSQDLIDYILSENFDFFTFQTLFTMPRTSYNHKQIISDLTQLIYRQLNNTVYRVYVGDMDIKAKKLGFFYIPDLTITLFGKEEYEKGYLTNPHSIIEVLSPSTEKKDHEEKKKEYLSIDSLQEYILIAQNGYKIEQLIRKNKTSWIMKVYESQEQTCILTVGVKIKLNELYKNVDWNK